MDGDETMAEEFLPARPPSRKRTMAMSAGDDYGTSKRKKVGKKPAANTIRQRIGEPAWQKYLKDRERIYYRLELAQKPKERRIYAQKLVADGDAQALYDYKQRKKRADEEIRSLQKSITDWPVRSAPERKVTAYQQQAKNLRQSEADKRAKRTLRRAEYKDEFALLRDLEKAKKKDYQYYQTRGDLARFGAYPKLSKDNIAFQLSKVGVVKITPKLRTALRLFDPWILEEFVTWHSKFFGNKSSVTVKEVYLFVIHIIMDYMGYTKETLNKMKKVKKEMLVPSIDPREYLDVYADRASWNKARAFLRMAKQFKNKGALKIGTRVYQGKDALKLLKNMASNIPDEMRDAVYEEMEKNLAQEIQSFAGGYHGGYYGGLFEQL